ncbi:hypothetical protein BXY57_1311 [Thermoflavifilum aggregans]|uniref:Uncharacterized protein n=1 Tax=Thermoflavifilum aggregans TaxID=454188 RepID=A0A2M9CUY1_9BACT|nr:hypothetical protein BXY57_1311 [Thermoflavifilum aggregans]
MLFDENMGSKKTPMFFISITISNYSTLSQVNFVCGEMYEAENKTTCNRSFDYPIKKLKSYTKM